MLSVYVLTGGVVVVLPPPPQDANNRLDPIASHAAGFQLMMFMEKPLVSALKFLTCHSEFKLREIIQAHQTSPVFSRMTRPLRKRAAGLKVHVSLRHNKERD
jgi:hypothetical protein